MKTVPRKTLVVTCLLAAIPMGYGQAPPDTTVHDKDMTVAGFEDIVYPLLANKTRTQGVVVIRAKLDKDGKVVDTSAISGSDLLIPESVANARKWRFQPNSAQTAVIVYNFRMPYAACNSQSIRSFSMLQAPNFVTVLGCETPVDH